MIERTQIVIRGDIFRSPETVEWLVAKIREAVETQDLVFIERGKDMEAGRLRHRVELQRVAVTTDSHGDQVKTWSTLDTVWAEKIELTGRERNIGAVILADVTHEFRIRARPDLALTPKDRVKYGSRVFDIRAVIERADSRSEYRLQCTEAV